MTRNFFLLACIAAALGSPVAGAEELRDVIADNCQKFATHAYQAQQFHGFQWDESGSMVGVTYQATSAGRAIVIDCYFLEHPENQALFFFNIARNGDPRRPITKDGEDLKNLILQFYEYLDVILPGMPLDIKKVLADEWGEAFMALKKQ